MEPASSQRLWDLGNPGTKSLQEPPLFIKRGGLSVSSTGKPMFNQPAPGCISWPHLRPLHTCLPGKDSRHLRWTFIFLETKLVNSRQKQCLPPISETQLWRPRAASQTPSPSHQAAPCPSPRPTPSFLQCRRSSFPQKTWLLRMGARDLSLKSSFPTHRLYDLEQITEPLQAQFPHLKNGHKTTPLSKKWILSVHQLE